MNVALYGKHFSEEFSISMIELLESLRKYNIQVQYYEPFYNYLVELNCIKESNATFFHTPEDILPENDFMICIGGDGTFLKCLPFLKEFQMPIVGVNSGRLGFLTNISNKEISKSIEALVNNDYSIDQRTLLSLSSKLDMDGFDPTALNEISVQKTDSNIIAVDTFINGEFLNTYWTDGLIVATSTGSTAYALSIGGPILQPASHGIVIAPIASHNLTVRPLVIHDSCEIKIDVRSRSGDFLLTADNKTKVIKDTCHSFYIKKSSSYLQMIKFPFNNYYSTLRNKLMWGSDKRNW